MKKSASIPLRAKTEKAMNIKRGKNKTKIKIYVKKKTKQKIGRKKLKFFFVRFFFFNGWSMEEKFLFL